MTKPNTSVQTHLDLVHFVNGEEASKAGYVYTQPEWEAAQILKAVVVKDGTQQGLPTVDFQIGTPGGKKYVVLITGRLLGFMLNVAYSMDRKILLDELERARLHGPDARTVEALKDALNMFT